MWTVPDLRKSLHLDQIIPMLEQFSIKPQANFVDDEIICPAIEFDIPVLGRTLYVPRGTSAVVHLPEGRNITYNAGAYYLNLPPQRGYAVTLVDVCPKDTPLPPIKGQTSDAWDTFLSVKVFWQVTRPEKAVGSPNFAHLLRDGARSEVADFLRTMPMERVILTPGGPATLSNQQIGRIIRNNLRERFISFGISIIEVLIIDRIGDKRCLDIINNVVIKSKTIEAELILEEKKNQLETKQIGLDGLLRVSRHKNDL